MKEDELVHLENSAAIFNCVSDAPSKVTVLNIDDLIESAFHLTLSMNDDVLRVQRQVHLGELQKELGEQMVSPGKRKQSLSTSMVSCKLCHVFLCCPIDCLCLSVTYQINCWWTVYLHKSST